MEDSREEEEEDDDDNNPDMIDLDNNYVNAEAARNAEQNASIGAGRDEETEEGSSDESAQELWDDRFKQGDGSNDARGHGRGRGEDGLPCRGNIR